MFKRYKRLHFVGIGGAGMSGIAEVLLNLGYTVSGSDLKESDITRRLARLGAMVTIGHRAESVANADVVIISSAVGSDNPEVLAARARGLPVIPRIEMLAELARLKYTIAVSGTHGKTTTTSMVAAVLQAGRLDPTVVLGGQLKHLDTGAQLGKGDYLVAEADESDGSFLKLAPTLAVITNIDNDHLDFYGTMEALRDAFALFANRVPFYGSAILCTDDPEVRRVLPAVQRRLVTYGLDEPARFQAREVRWDDGRNQFTAVEGGRPLGALALRLPGQHNVLNALAAVAVGCELEIPFEAIAHALESFEGVGRRLEVREEVRGILVLDDYGHHPTEIRATLAALRQMYPGRRLIVLFQPHRYSRTQLLCQAFGTAFQDADEVRLLDVYPAGEKPLPGVTSDLVLQVLQKNHSHAMRFDPSKDLQNLASSLQPSDVVLTLGAGDVWKVGESLLEVLRTMKFDDAHDRRSHSKNLS